ncbi:MAG: glycosyltransferase family 9 protein [Burkholderiaceae bacterium]
MPRLKRQRIDSTFARIVESCALKILIVKLSSLGDVLHTLPVVHDIHTAHPDAQIDWVVEKSFAGVVRRCAGVNRVVTCELRKWRKAIFAKATRQAWQAFKMDLQQTQYDAVIDLQGLTKSAVIARLAKLEPTQVSVMPWRIAAMDPATKLPRAGWPMWRFLSKHTAMRCSVGAMCARRLWVMI